jgi:hypothetical protein
MDNQLFIQKYLYYINWLQFLKMSRVTCLLEGVISHFLLSESIVLVNNTHYQFLFAPSTGWWKQIVKEIWPFGK